MKLRYAAVLSVFPAMLLGACGSDTPAQSTPVAVAPTPTPVPPTTTPSLIPIGRLSLTIIGFLRNDILLPIPGGNPFPVLLQEQDIVQLDCTPRDANGVQIPANRHSKDVEWYWSNQSLVPNVEYECGDNSFNPDCRLIHRVNGWFEVYCRLSGVQSNVLRFNTHDKAR